MKNKNRLTPQGSRMFAACSIQSRSALRENPFIQRNAIGSADTGRRRNGEGCRIVDRLGIRVSRSRAQRNGRRSRAGRRSSRSAGSGVEQLEGSRKISTGRGGPYVNLVQNPVKIAADLFRKICSGGQQAPVKAFEEHIVVPYPFPYVTRRCYQMHINPMV